MSKVVEVLAAWLRKRGEPDSGLDYERRGRYSDRPSRVELYGDDADFVAKHFHGQGAIDLASALSAIQAPSDAEPVAWRYHRHPGWYWLVFSDDDDRCNPDTRPRLIAEGYEVQPLYLASPSYSAAIEDAARVLEERRQLLHHQHEVIDIDREDAVYDICIAAIRALTPRTT